MSGGLPIQIDPLDLAKNQVQLEGQYSTAKLPRLAEYSPSKDATVHVKLGFHQENDALIKVSGNIDLRLHLTCERCMQPFGLDISLKPEFYFDVSGAEPDEQDERDIIQVKGPVDLKSLVEDEILLALPMIPMHEPDQCAAGGNEYREDADKQQTDANHPFAQLAALLKDMDKD
jgi:uncharacterized protein